MAVARDGDAVQSLEAVGGPDGQGHGDHRQRAGFHRDAETRDDVGRMAGLRSGRHVLHGLVFRGSVILGDHDHRGREPKADERAQPHRHAMAAMILCDTK